MSQTPDEEIVPVYLRPGEQARALAGALNRLGFTAVVLTGHDHRKHPCVTVTSGPGRVMETAGFVYVAPDEDGTWRFWLPSRDDQLVLESLAPISEVSVTADAVDRALTRARAVFSQAG